MIILSEFVNRSIFIINSFMGESVHDIRHAFDLSPSYFGQV